MEKKVLAKTLTEHECQNTSKNSRVRSMLIQNDKYILKHRLEFLTCVNNTNQISSLLRN